MHGRSSFLVWSNNLSRKNFREGLGLYPGSFVPTGFSFQLMFRFLDLTRNCLFKGVRLRKVSHWPPWLIKIFRKRVKEVRKRVSWKIKILIKKLCCLHRSYWAMQISKLLEISQMMLDQCIVMTRGRARWRCSEILGSLEDLTTCEVTKTFEIADWYLPALLVERNICWVYFKYSLKVPFCKYTECTLLSCVGLFLSDSGSLKVVFTWFHKICMFPWADAISFRIMT